MNMNTPWSLHSAGANPPLKLWGACSFLGMQSVDKGNPLALLKGPQWMEWLSLWSSITVKMMAF